MTKKDVSIRMDCWKSLDAIRMENAKMEAVILPALGGKTASIFYKSKDFELAAQHSGPYRLPDADSAFADFDASGLDDAFPTIVSGHLDGANAAYRYTDHGEIWRSRFEIVSMEEKVVLRYESAENPFTYEKTITMDDDCLHYDYRITNTGAEDFPCLWAMHGLARYEPDMELLYPTGIGQFLNVAPSRELGEPGQVYLSFAHDFHHVPPLGADTELKYYALGTPTQGVCGYRYPTQGVGCTITYDALTLPYLGMWVTAGGFRGDYNCAWEPTNGFYDSIETAWKNKALKILHSRETLSFSIGLRLSDL